MLELAPEALQGLGLRLTAELYWFSPRPAKTELMFACPNARSTTSQSARGRLSPRASISGQRNGVLFAYRRRAETSLPWHQQVLALRHFVDFIARSTGLVLWDIVGSCSPKVKCGRIDRTGRGL
jgi:hypothetical protein